MTEPVAFDTTTPRQALPMLVAGQAQKEFFVNEAFARIDALLHPVVEGVASTPPASPAPGESWVIADPASDEWAGHAHALASWDGAQWTFCAPTEGMQVFDRTLGARRAFLGSWQSPTRPAQPTGGTVIDTEARAAVTAIIGMLAKLGVIPPE